MLPDALLWLVLIVAVLFIVVRSSKRGSNTEPDSGLSEEALQAFSPPGAEPENAYFNERPPNGWDYWEEDIQVAGTSQYQPAITKLYATEEPEVYTVMEPDNPHDPNAVRIVGVWDDGEGTVGYLPRKLAAKYVKQLGKAKAVNTKLRAIFPPRPKRSAGLRIAIHRKVR